MELSYSFHLSNDKNKTARAKEQAKKNNSNTTSYSNNAIQNLQQLSKADKHNLRKYDNNNNLIMTIKGTSSLVEDTKKLYYELFNEALEKYNEKQTRTDRKIDDYFYHISNDKEHDLACEIIIELGDLDYWSDKSLNVQYKMNEVFKEQVEALELIVPNFKVANATIHFDESSPHLHIIGVPFKEDCKRGLERQVGKSTIFTKESLSTIQDKMRDHCIISFNKTYNVDYTLKIKEQGRNEDINVADMKKYTNVKKEKKKYKEQLNKLNEKTDTLSNNTNKINEMIDNLKVSKLNKDNYIISKDKIDEIKDYLELTTSTTKTLRDSNKIDSILNKFENYLKQHKNEVEILEKKVYSRDTEIARLKNQLVSKNEEFDELEDIVDKLQEIVNTFKQIWRKFLMYLQNKFFSNDKKIHEMIDELYYKDILDDKDIKIIHNDCYDRHNNRDDDMEL